MDEGSFNIILSKNRLARTVRDLYNDMNEPVPEHVLFDFEEIEQKTGTANQPTAYEILTSKDKTI